MDNELIRSFPYERVIKIRQARPSLASQAPKVRRIIIMKGSIGLEVI